MIDAGRGSFELTGLTDEDVIGRPVQEVLGLQWLEQGDGGETADTDGDGVTDPIETSLEWGVRSLGKRVSVNAEGDLRPRRSPTSSPPTTTTAGCCSSSPRRAEARHGQTAPATSSSCSSCSA